VRFHHQFAILDVDIDPAAFHQLAVQVGQVAPPGSWSERYGERPASALAEVRLT